MKRSAEKSAEFLVRATEALSSSLNYNETFLELGSLAVRSLADWCVIDVVVDGAEPRSVAIEHYDPRMRLFAMNLLEQYPRDWTAAKGPANVLRTAQSELYPHISEEMLSRMATDEDCVNPLRQLGLKSAMVVPLTARGKMLGVITLATAESGRSYALEDLIVAEELARRAAIAIDNAGLYEAAQVAIRARDEFFSIASHELKTPVSVMRMSVDLVREKMDQIQAGEALPESVMKLLDASSRQADRLTHLIDDLLDVVKARAGKLDIHREELDLSELVKEVANGCASALEAAKCPLELDIQPGVRGHWDRNRLEQVLVNLISNASKYAAGAPVRIGVSREGPVARLVVEDRGPGIPPEQQAKIFDRFERMISSRAISGLGLGLYIVKQIVEAHDGTVLVQSELGKGSKFIVELEV